MELISAPSKPQRRGTGCWRSELFFAILTLFFLQASLRHPEYLLHNTQVTFCGKESLES